MLSDLHSNYKTAGEKLVSICGFRYFRPRAIVRSNILLPPALTAMFTDG